MYKLFIIVVRNAYGMTHVSTSVVEYSVKEQADAAAEKLSSRSKESLSIEVIKLY